MKHFDYRPAPFWFLNHRLEKDELRRQIKIMSDCGISGFFLHPRAGNYLQTYGSKEWFEKMRFIAEEAEKAGLKAWLYDEDPFPSGAAGGRVAFENPVFAARALRIWKIPCNPDTLTAQQDLGHCKVLSAYAVKMKDGKIVDKIDVSDSVGTVRDKFFNFMHKSAYYCDMRDLVYLHPRAETFFPQMRLQVALPDGGYTVYAATAETVVESDKYGFLPDNLNDKCTDLFIELTHEKYKTFIGDKFGETVPGIFLDESKSGGIIPWTGDIEEVFYKMHGYSARENYMHFAINGGAFSRKFRFDYLTTVYSMLSERLYKKLSKWCRKNGLMLTGHILCEEDPVTQSMLGENVYNSVKYFDIPGFDIVGNNLGDRRHFALALGAKTVSSSARRQGKRIVMSEAFACNPFNFGADGLKRMAGWLFACGITWLVPHGFYYSYDGLRKSDAGASFFFQHPQFDELKDFFNAAGSTGKMLAEGDRICDTCLLLPTYEFRELAYAERELSEKLRQFVTQAALALTENHIEWDVIDYDALYGGKAEMGYIKIGKCRYKNVVISDGKNNCGHPFKAARFLQSKGINVIIADESGFDVQELKKAAAHTEITNISGDARNIMSVKMKDKNGEFTYLFNNSPDSALIGLSGGGQVTDPWTNVSYDLVAENGLARIYLEGYQAIFVRHGAPAEGLKTFPHRYKAEKKTYDYETAPQWDYTPAGCKIIEKIINWDIEILHTGLKKEYKSQRFGQIRNFHGTAYDYLKDLRRKPYCDAAPVYSHYPVKAEFKAAVTLDKGEYNLLFEESTFSGNCRIYVNGKEIEPKDIIRKTVYDFTNRYITVKTDENGLLEIRAVFDKADEFDGLYGIIYIVQ